MSEEIELIIKKIKVAMLKHTQEFYDYDILVDYELDYNQWKKLLDYINNLQQKVEQQEKEIERLNNIINECSDDILKELEENNHLSYGVALSIRNKLLDYKELKEEK